MKQFPNTIHNQTNPESIAKVNLMTADESDKIGTGVFIIPDPTNPELGYQSVKIPNLTYTECEQRAEYCIAFKWIASSTMLYEDIIKLTPANCTGNFCPSPSCGPSGSTCACVGGNCYI